MFYSCLQFLFVHEVFCLRFSAYEMQLDWIRVRWLTWILNNIPLLCYKKTLVAFKVCTRSYNIAPCTSQFALLLFSAVISSVNTRGTGSTGSRHTHAVIWGDMLVIMSSSCPSPYSSLDIILVQVGLFFIYPQDSVPELYGMFLPKWNLVNGLHLKETLYIYSGEVVSWLMTLTQIHLPPIAKGFFFTRERILLSSTTNV